MVLGLWQLALLNNVWVQFRGKREPGTVPKRLYNETTQYGGWNREGGRQHIIAVEM